MAFRTIFTLTIFVAILLAANAFIAFYGNQPLKWLWLAVALFGVLNVFLVYKRKDNQTDRR